MPPIRSAGNNAAAAAAEAARRAAEAARRAAEAARRAAEAARQQAAQAREQQQAAQQRQQAAQQQQQTARQELVQGTQQLKEAKPEQRKAAEANVERLRGDLSTAHKGLQAADRTLKEANGKLQKAEERVARTAQKAEGAMTGANAAARKDPASPSDAGPYSKNEIAKTGMQAQEIKDAFNGAEGKQRNTLAKQLGVEGSASKKELQADLDADRDFAQLQQDPAKAKTLEAMNIRDGKELRGFGQRMARRAEGAEPGTNDVKLKSIKDKDSLTSIIKSSANTLQGKDKATVQGDLFAKQVASGQEPQKAANLKGAELAVATFDKELKGVVDKPVKDWTAADAKKYTEALADQVEKNKGDAEAVESLMTLSGQQLKRSAEIIGQATEEKGNKEDVKGLTTQLSRIGNDAPPRAAAQLAIGIANEIPEDSEQNYVDDGFGEFVDKQGGPSRFRDTIAAALQQQGKEEAAEELVEKEGGSSLGDRFGDVVDTLEDAGEFILDKGKDAAGAAFNFVSEQVIGRMGDAIRNTAANALNIDDQIKELKSEGDSFVAKAGVEGSLFGAELGVGVEMKITKTKDGYSMELQGEGSAGVAGKLKLPGLGGADLSATGTASANVKFEFKNAQDVEKASETVAGVAVGVAATAAGGPLAPVGAAMVASAGDELGFIADHYESTTLKLEQKAEVSADLGDKLGLPGASVGASASTAQAIEIPKDGPPSLILNQTVGVEGKLDIAGALPLPSGGTLSPGNLAGSAEISLETKVPINLSPGELISNPVDALTKAGRTAINESTTTLSANVEFAAGAKIENGPVSLGGDQGLQVSLSAEAKTKDLAGALGKAVTGDLSGALGALGKDVTVSGEVRAFTEDTVGFEDEGVSVGVASIDVTASATTRSSTILTDFSGTPEQLLQRFGGVINGVNFQKAA